MDILSARSNAKQDEQTYRQWFDYADSGILIIISVMVFLGLFDQNFVFNDCIFILIELD